MLRTAISFILHSRPENVLAVAVSLGLLVFFALTHCIVPFQFGMHDFLFILLPMGILGVKCLLGMLVSSGRTEADAADLASYVGRFFQPLVTIVRDWFPFLLLSACYYSLYSNLILRVNPNTADGVLSRVDSWLLGGQAALLLEPYIQPWITDVLNLVYFSFVLLLPGIALYFYLAKEEKAFRRIMMGYLTLILMGVTSYLLVPAVGPEIHFASRFSRDLNGQVLSHGVDYIIRTGRVCHDCFPSLHVGIPLLLTFYIRRYRPRCWAPALVYVALMCCATVYLRYHYVVDVIAAFAYAPAAYWLNDWFLAHWPGERAAGSPVALAAQPAEAIREAA